MTISILVPSRGRPQSLGRMVEAFRATMADRVATLTFIVDQDDPRFDDYVAEATHCTQFQRVTWLTLEVESAWHPLVPKLNRATRRVLERETAHPIGVGFFGDDHVPRTAGWAQQMRAVAASGCIAYGDDGIQGGRLPTHWVMDSRIALALGRMVPAAVDHLYCDDSIRELGQATNRLRYLPDVLIEHMHPVADKTPWDEGYRRVNAHAQYQLDHAAYERWRLAPGGLSADAKVVSERVPAVGGCTWPQETRTSRSTS